VHTRRRDDVWVVHVDGPLRELAAGLDHHVQCALAEFPRAVVCLLPDHPDVGDTVLDRVAAVGRHARAWPDTPVVVSSPDPLLRDAVGRRPEGRHLAFACSLESALARAGAQPPLRSTRVKLPASPTAARTARRVLARACEEWEVPGCRGTGELVVSELVTNALQHARSHLTLVVASDAARMVRVGVHDPLRVAPSTRAPSEDGLGGRGLHIVETVAEAAGALPASDGGKVVWATVAVDGGLS
jgi:anti-sigma regulatory factor (Ser/Thr protein kinase)